MRINGNKQKNMTGNEDNHDVQTMFFFFDVQLIIWQKKFSSLKKKGKKRRFKGEGW